jgi:hypothetical protein
VHPDLVDLEVKPEESGLAGLNRGMVDPETGRAVDGVSLYREGQAWRRKILDELRRQPKWVAEWRAEAAHDQRIKELCEAKGYKFAPHECEPWAVPSEGAWPYGPTSAGAFSWPKAQKLRRQLERELAEQDAAARPRARARRARRARR